MLSITHIHTHHSWDGNIEPGVLVDALAAADISLALVSDHNTFDGALECRRIAAERGLDLRVPVAAEVRTERGDVIIVFDDEPPALPPIAEMLEWATLEDAVRGAGGLIWLPHPYQSHEFTEELAEGADVIEVFNVRCSDEQNRNAGHLCTRHDAVPAYGADVHRRAEIGLCMVHYDDRGSVVETLRHAPAPLHTEQSRRSEIMAAEIVAARGRRQPLWAAYLGVRWARYRIRERRQTQVARG